MHTNNIFGVFVPTPPPSIHTTVCPKTKQAFICLGNLANNTLNQAHVGAGGSVDLALTVCKHCQSAR